MTKVSRLVPEFVEFAPPELKEGVLYVSMIYGSAVHKCCCGCGEKVVTPFSPTDWKLTFDGETVSLQPSIGTWSFKCRSHYWIRANEIYWAPAWTEEQIDAGRERDRTMKFNYFKRRQLKSAGPAPQTGAEDRQPSAGARQKIGSRVAAWLRGLFRAE
jgi:Family of unknown function (DUF6527)